jgi:hypothetical protein
MLTLRSKSKSVNIELNFCVDLLNFNLNNSTLINMLGFFVVSYVKIPSYIEHKKYYIVMKTHLPYHIKV